MRIGYYVSDRGLTLDEIVDRAKTVGAAGLPSAWTSDVGSWDALTVLAVVGREVPGIELASGVVVSHSRPPLTLAAQALTVQGATGNRLTLGVGVSHQYVVEAQFGASFERPARHLREYLSALVPLLRGESVDVRGETLRATGSIGVPVGPPPSVLVSALGPVLLRLAGELADGTVTAWAGPRTVAEHIAPTISTAAESAGRPAPRIVVGQPVLVADDETDGRQRLAEALGPAGTLPAYRAVLDREGPVGPADVAVVGSAESIARQLRRYADAGGTEFVAFLFGTAEEQSRARTLLGELSD
jgi:F420-dependent oxidoreductase-like protein